MSIRLLRLAGAVTSTALVLVVVPAGAQAASGTPWQCDASVLRGTLLTSPVIEPVTANAGATSCQTAQGGGTNVLGALPLPVHVDLLSAQTTITGPADRTDLQKVDATSSVANLAIGASGLPALPLPALDVSKFAAVPIDIPVLPALPGLPDISVPGTADLRSALLSIAPTAATPTADLLDVSLIKSDASGSCVGGKPSLNGTSSVADAKVLGTDLPVGQVVNTVVNAAGGGTLNTSALTTNPNLSAIIPVTPLSALLPTQTIDLSALNGVLKTAVANLPAIQLPVALANINLIPNTQTLVNGRLTQLALHADISIPAAGLNLLNIDLGRASVAGAGVNCAAPVASVASLSLQCTTRKLVLIDVVRKGNQVSLLGAADKKYIGRRVSIVFPHTGQVVATPVVQPDGTFTATAPLPAASIRYTNLARYQARIDNERSLNLKLFRRMVTQSVTSSGGKVTIAGRIVRPLATPARPIVIKQRVSCSQLVTVGKVMPARDGSFRVTLPGPPQSQAAVYRLQTQVRKNTRNRKLYPTFTLPRAVEFK
jgi:hypothetical protein